MNYFWKNSKLGMYNAKELREKLWLGKPEFDKLMEFESRRYKASMLKRYWKEQGEEYFAARVSENPFASAYGNTPTFPPHPSKSKLCVFNDESGVYLEKAWSRKNKYNQNPDGQNLPFDFVFDPDKKA